MKSISPAIATILLIVITVLMASITYLWFSGMFQRFLSQSEKQVEYITDVSLLQISDVRWYDYRNGLVLELRFDEGSGLVAKSSVNNIQAKLREVGCSYSIKTYNSHYYEFYYFGCGDEIGIKPKWKYVKDYCEKQGGYLVIVKDSNEANWIKSQVPWSLWLGYYQDPDNLNDNNGWPEGCPGNEPSGCWKWLPNESSTWVNWRIGEPNNAGGVEHCAHFIWGLGNTEMNDLFCGGFLSWVCEYTIQPSNKNINGKLSYPKWVNGLIGKALYFDGVDDWVQINNFSKYDPKKEITIIALVKPLESNEIKSQLREDIDGFIIANRRSVYVETPDNLGVAWRSWTLYMDRWGTKPGRVCGCISTNEKGVKCICGGNGFYDKKWHFVGMKFDGQKLYVFADGKTLVSVDWPGTIYYDYLYQGYNVDWRLFIGDFDGETSPGKKIIDELRIYNKALPDDVIKNLFYPLQLVIYNPSDKPIKIENSTISITNLESKRSCIFKLTYNKTYITDPDNTLIIYPNKQIILKVTIIECPGVLERGKEHQICLISQGKKACNKFRIL